MQEKPPNQFFQPDDQEQSIRFKRNLFNFFQLVLIIFFFFSALEEEGFLISGTLIAGLLRFCFSNDNNRRNVSEKSVTQVNESEAKVKEESDEDRKGVMTSIENLQTEIKNFPFDKKAFHEMAQNNVPLKELLSKLGEGEITSTSEVGGKAFREAAQINNVLLMKFLLTLCKEEIKSTPGGLKKYIDKIGPQSGKSALHFAAKEGAKEATEFLVKAGADVNLQDNQGNTPIHYAIAALLTQKRLGNATNYQPLIALLTTVPITRGASVENRNDNKGLEQQITKFKKQVLQQDLDQENLQEGILTELVSNHMNSKPSKKSVNNEINASLKNKYGRTIYDLFGRLNEFSDSFYKETTEYIAALHKQSLELTEDYNHTDTLKP